MIKDIYKKIVDMGNNFITHINSPLTESILSDKSIMRYNKKGLLIEQPILEKQLQPNSVDLTLSNNWKTLFPNIRITDSEHNTVFGAIDTKQEINYMYGNFTKGNTKDTLNISPYNSCMSPNPNVFNKVTERYEFNIDSFNENEKIIIAPNQFMLFATNEILNIPNGIIGFVCGRSSIARLGIQVEQAGLIDAGFRGTITLELFNQTQYPIILYAGMRIAQVYFVKAQKANVIYGIGKKSKYNDQIYPTVSRIHLDE